MSLCLGDVLPKHRFAASLGEGDIPGGMCETHMAHFECMPPRRGLKELSQQLLSAARGEASLYAVGCELDDHIAAGDMTAAQRTLLALVGEVGALKSRGIVPAKALPAAPTA